MAALMKILFEEDKYSDLNYYLMQLPFEYRSKYLSNKDGGLFLTVDSLIELNNIITHSQNSELRRVNVKPAGHSKMYMDRRFVEVSLYCLLGNVNGRIISQQDFCRAFLEIHPFRDGNGRTCKLLFASNVNKIL